MALTPIQAIARLPVDGEILHKITQGPATGPSSQVQTENGLVSTAARAIALVQAVSEQAIGEIHALAAAQGYQVPVAYGAGIQLTTANQTVEYNGQTYAPIATALPFTTSGAFEADKFRLIQGVSAADLAASTGASLVGFAQDLTGAALRQVNIKASEIVSVTDWPGGPLDHTGMFSAAAQNAPGIDNVPPPYNALPHPITAVVRVPAGNYTLSSLVDTGGREVTWVLDPAANIVGIDYLNGSIVRDGQRKTKRFPLGTLDQAAGHYFAVGTSSNDRNPPVLGVWSTQQMADYAQRDAVGLVAAAYSQPALVKVATATYTDKTAKIDPLDADTIKRLRPGMAIYTGHAVRCCGFLESWSSDGSELRVPEWCAKGGTAAVTPADGFGLSIGVDKQWGFNVVLNMNPDGSATQGIAVELSVRNHLGDSTSNIDDPTNRVWGCASITEAASTPGAYQSQTAFIARGNWYYGYVSHDQAIGYYYQSPSAKVGFQYKGIGTAFQVINPTTGNLSYRLNYTGDLELGQREAASTSGKIFRFNTSGLSTPGGDSNITASGGNGQFGNGMMVFNAIANAFGGDVYPTANNVRALGLPSFLWTVVRAKSGAIDTSDGTVKTPRSVDGVFEERELVAWGEVRQIVYQFNDSIAEKGADRARLHAGYIAQAIQEVFAAHGLDVSRYGFWCEDDVTEAVSITQTVSRQKMTTVEETVEAVELVDGIPTLKKRVVQKEIGVTVLTQVVDEQGKPVFAEYPVYVRDGQGQPVLGPDGLPLIVSETRPVEFAVPVMEDVEETVEVHQPAGKRLGLRYSECDIWEAAWVRWQLELERAARLDLTQVVSELTARVHALENTAGGASQTTNP